MKTPANTRRALRWLRRAETGALARGLLWGLLLPAPCAFAVYLCAGRVPPPFAVAPARPWPEIDSTASDAELSYALAPFLRGEATLIAGSSEMTRGRDASFEQARSATERLAACVDQTPLQSLAPAGHAARRAARLIERLRGRFRSTRPVRLIVLDNSHYASAAAQTVIEDRNFFLTDADYARFRLLREPGRAGAEGATRFFALRRLDVQSFRAFLGRRILQPMHQGFFARSAPADDPVRAAPAPAPEPDLEYLRLHKVFPADLRGASYGRALAELGAAAQSALPPGSQWRVLALPLNAAYYARLGFSPEDIAALSERRRAALEQAVGPHLVLTPELGAGPLFVDAAHYTAAGRARLAETICRVALELSAQ